MKNITLLIMLSILFIYAKAQNVNGVSTNPINPVNPPFLPWANSHLGSGFTQDPFLNQFDWGPVSPNGNLTDYIPIEYLTGFNIAGISLSGNQIPMKNPFNTGLDGGLSLYMNSVLNPAVQERDFKWQDGWELLWMNLGYTPDLNLINTSNPASPLGITGPNPVHAPYFVLYNRYKGTMRLFANVWFNSTTANKPQKVMTTLKFNNDNELNGLLRHNSSYDLALDNKTVIKNISGPTFNFTDQYKWLMSDFQVGFDPCICTRTTNNTRLNFEFSTIQTMNIDMISRSISVQQSITDNSYLADDFLNLNDVGPTMNYKPGSRIYSKMDNMLDGYLKAVDKYKTDLANYNSLDATISRTIMQAAKDGINAAGGSIGDALASKLFVTSDIKNLLTKVAPRASIYSLGLVKLDPNDAEQYTKDLQKATKGIIGNSFDFLSAQIDIPSAPPAPPSPPTATLTETTFKGGIKTNNIFPTEPLLIPGSLPLSFQGGSPGINRLNYPAYNEVLGLFALLETPKLEVKVKPKNENIIYLDLVKRNVDRTYNKYETNFEVKVKDALKYRFNHVLDFNFNKTKLYYSLRIKLKTYGSNQGNTFFSSREMEIINESNNFSFESYGPTNDAIGVITTPFVEIKGALNEPLTFTSKADILTMFNNMGLQGNIGQYANFFNKLTNIESIDLKLMADMYFLSPGSKGQEINTLQTFTYKIYENSGNDNQTPDELNSTIGNVTFLKQNETILKHQSGNVVFDNIQLSPATIPAYTHYTINATEMHIYVENAILKNNITVAPGYKAYIHFLGEALSEPETEMFPELVIEHMKSEDLYQNALIYEATNEEVTNFCSLNNNKYQANTSLSKSTPLVEKPKEEQEPKDTYIIYPNPASGGEFNILLSVKENTNVTITLFDLTGKQIAEICNKQMEKGNHQAVFNTENLSAGVYFCKLNTGYGETKTQKLIITK